MSSSRCYESATNKIKSTSPGDSSNVNHFIGDIAASLITVKKNPQYLPKYCNTVTDHCDTIYVGTRVRFWDNPSDKSCGREGFVHWVCNKGIFMSFPNDNKCEFVQLSANDRWVVKQQEVLHGALRILVKPHTDDILLDEQNLTSKEIIMRSSKKFLNDVYFRFPTGTDRDSYDCLFFKKQCNCAVKNDQKGLPVQTVIQTILVVDIMLAIIFLKQQIRVRINQLINVIFLFGKVNLIMVTMKIVSVECFVKKLKLRKILGTTF